MKKAIVILSLLLLISVIINLSYLIRDGPPEDIERKECHIDTIPYRKPVPVDSVVVRYITEKVPVVDDSISLRASFSLRDSLEAVYAKNSKDSVKVVIPITQKVYEDSTFKAYVSGYHPALDSIEIYRKSETFYIRSPTKTKRWSVGIQAGLGLTPSNVQPYIGVGVSYNLFSF